MTLSKIGYQVASWAFVTVGIGHTFTYLFSPKNTEQIDFIEKMHSFSISIANQNVSIFSFYEGFSLMMGLLLIAYGSINLLISKNNTSSIIPANIIVFNILVSSTALVFSIIYFFIVPVVFTGLATLGYSFSLIARKK